MKAEAKPIMATTTFDGFRKGSTHPTRFQPGFYSVQWRCCRIFSWIAAAAVKVGTGLLTTA